MSGTGTLTGGVYEWGGEIHHEWSCHCVPALFYRSVKVCPKCGAVVPEPPAARCVVVCGLELPCPGHDAPDLCERQAENDLSFCGLPMPCPAHGFSPCEDGAGLSGQEDTMDYDTPDDLDDEMEDAMRITE